MVIGFTIDYPQKGSRSAYRACVPGLFCHVPEGADGEDGQAAMEVMPVKDLSAAGVAVLDARARLVLGMRTKIDLVLDGETLLTGIETVVVRVANVETEPDRLNLVGLKFPLLDRRQELCVDKLVLEAQKRAIDKLHAERQAQDRKNSSKDG